MADYVPAEVFPPGATIQAELEELGWTQIDLAEVMGRPLKTISELVNGKVRVTEDTANELELALGIDADFWLRTEAHYRLYTSAKPAPKIIGKRAEIRRRVPLRQMAARGWISLTDDQDELQRRVEAFLEGPLDKPIEFTMAAKQSSYDEPLSPEQEAWLLRAKHLAETMQVPTYSRSKLLHAVDQMRELLRSPDDAYHFQKLLSYSCVLFLIV
jgi:HTH-type transcriptional regulator/antitoxin HigA